jgi:hypothetical protein
MKNNFITRLVIFIIIASALTLPFHWVLSEPIIVPKKNLSFDRTFVSEDDVQEIVEKFYLGSPKEKFEVENDPLTKALVKRWDVYQTDNGDTVFQHLTN